MDADDVYFALVRRNAPVLATAWTTLFVPKRGIGAASQTCKVTKNALDLFH